LPGYRPRTINRAALIVRPKQPYVDWANSVDDDAPQANLQEARTDPSIYLVECVDFLENRDLLVDETWEWICREQLSSWMRDEDLWPEVLTHEMFHDWFDCELSTMIWDLLKTKIKPSS